MSNPTQAQSRIDEHLRFLSEIDLERFALKTRLEICRGNLLNHGTKSDIKLAMQFATAVAYRQSPNLRELLGDIYRGNDGAYCANLHSFSLADRFNAIPAPGTAANLVAKRLQRLQRQLA